MNLTPVPSLSNLAEDGKINELRDLILVAQGKKEATLLLKNCRIVDVYSGEIYQTDIGIYENKIASVTAGAVLRAREVIDCQGCYAIPGMIDPHMHVDTTMLWPSELARVLVPLGTTTVFVDMVNIAHNGGKAAIKAMMEAFEGLPLRAYFSAPSYCPLDPELETAAAEIDSADIAEMLQWDKVVSIGETVSSKILNLEPDFLARLAVCNVMDKIVSGHGGDLPCADEPSLDAYVASGVRDDHCIARVDDILPRLRRGVSMFLVEAPGREQVKAFFEYILAHEIPTHKMSLCIDNITIMDIVGAYGGYLDKPFRMGLESGLSAVDVVRMATLNPATHYKKDSQLGSLTPGRFADIVLLRELDRFPPEIVIANGKVAARQGRMIGEIPTPVIAPDYLNSVHLPAGFSADYFTVPAEPDKPAAAVRVIRVQDGEAFNQCFEAELEVVQGDVQPDLEHDILKIAIIERYGQRGSMTTAFVNGFHLQHGAIATSYSVPSNNIVVVGTNGEDMAFAAEQIARMQGGFVVVDNGQMLAEVSLQIGGIMTSAPYENVLEDVEKANAAARSLGCPLEHPFFTMAQTVLSSLPDLGLTDRGLVDVPSGKVIDVVIKE